VNWAFAQLGTAESPPGSNNVRYNTLYYGKAVSGDAYPWCVTFLWAGFRECGLASLFCGGGKTAGCRQLMEYAQANGLWVTGNYRKGDLLLYGSPPSHAGIFTGEMPGGLLDAIEGNYSNKVCRVRRRPSEICGAYRPKWEEESPTGSAIVNDPVQPYSYGRQKVTVELNLLRAGSFGPQVKALQLLLNGLGCPCGEADSIFGSRTLAAVKQWQKEKGLEIDGIVGTQTWNSFFN
jgi:hypothetical protein